MKRKTVLITTGPTREYIDPVRFISNRSSGKLGVAIAEEFVKNKYKVILVSGQTKYKPKIKITTFYVETSQQMYEVVKKYFSKSDVFISAAAVCDFKPNRQFVQKIKKNKKTLVLKLVPTIDILQYCGEHKTENQVVVGFALETDRKNAVKYAIEKLKNKKLDLIILNSLETFDSDYITPTLIYPSGKTIQCKKMTKKMFAKLLVNIVSNMLNKQ